MLLQLFLESYHDFCNAMSISNELLEVNTLFHAITNHLIHNRKQDVYKTFLRNKSKLESLKLKS